MKVFLFWVGLCVAGIFAYANQDKPDSRLSVPKPAKFVRPPGLNDAVNEKPEAEEKFPCPKCSGTGKVKKLSGKALVGVNCSLCNGIGKAQLKVKQNEKPLAIDIEKDVPKPVITWEQLENLKKALKRLEDLNDRFDSYTSAHACSYSGYYRGGGYYYSYGRGGYEKMEEEVEKLKDFLKKNKAPSTVITPIASIQTKFSHKLTPSVTYPETRRLSKIAIEKLEEFCEWNEALLNQEDDEYEF